MFSFCLNNNYNQVSHKPHNNKTFLQVFLFYNLKKSFQFEYAKADFLSVLTWAIALKLKFQIWKNYLLNIFLFSIFNIQCSLLTVISFKVKLGSCPYQFLILFYYLYLQHIYIYYCFNQLLNFLKLNNYQILI